MKALAGHVLLPSTVTSPATCSAADATTPRLAAASPKTTCALQEMARVCRQPIVKPTPTVTPLVWDVPPMTSCAVWRMDDVRVMEVIMAAIDKVSEIQTYFKTVQCIFHFDVIHWHFLIVKIN